MDKRHKPTDSANLEHQLSELLTEGEMEQQDLERVKRDQVFAKYEVRIQTKMNPIAEETKKFRSMAKEVDNRYDRYCQPSKEE